MIYSLSALDTNKPDQGLYGLTCSISCSAVSSACSLGPAFLAACPQQLPALSALPLAFLGQEIGHLAIHHFAPLCYGSLLQPYRKATSSGPVFPSIPRSALCILRDSNLLLLKHMPITYSDSLWTLKTFLSSKALLRLEINKLEQ